MVVSERMLKWAMRFYPPLLLQRIWVVKFDKGFKGVQVKIIKSILNKNYNNAIFGGTIFSAADPFYPVLFHQLLIQKGYKLKVWSKSSSIHYLKPGASNLYFSITLTDAEIEHAEMILNTEGKYMSHHPIDIYNKDGEICVSVMNEVYLRNLNFTSTNL
jgi:acyl-coenzyme A thioesterase PaaI-like protein